MFMTHDSVWGTSMVKPPDFISNSCCREQLDGAKFLSLVPDLLNTIWISMTSMSCRLRQDVQLLENYLNKDDAHLDASCLTQTQPRSWLYMLFLAWKSVSIIIHLLMCQATVLDSSLAQALQIDTDFLMFEQHLDEVHGAGSAAQSGSIPFEKQRAASAGSETICIRISSLAGQETTFNVPKSTKLASVEPVGTSPQLP